MDHHVFTGHEGWDKHNIPNNFILRLKMDNHFIIHCSHINSLWL